MFSSAISKMLGSYTTKNPPSDTGDTKPQTPSIKSKFQNDAAKSRNQSPDPKSRSQSPSFKSKSQTPGMKTPSFRESKSKSMPDALLGLETFTQKETVNPNEKNTQTRDDEWLDFTTEPSDEPGKMNTGVNVKPKTTDVSTDTTEDADGCDDYGIGGFSQKSSYTRSASGTEFRYRHRELGGNHRCLNSYSCGYLHPFDTRYQGFFTQTDRYSEVVRPLRHSTYPSSSECCSRRL
ncbi:unnamed protein product [Candidula unifasciata]|uniref:Uncharacterized protein n=1 Tax=Candidula unifasciata TaxID=100452 RepID=A0A8S3YVK6_9EUPU|nr:unnamed protein product [Candidula unifasciata]